MPDTNNAALLVVGKQRIYLSADSPFFGDRVARFSATGLTSRIDNLVAAARAQGAEVAWVRKQERRQYKPELFDYFGETMPEDGEREFITDSFSPWSDPGFASWVLGVRTLVIVGGYSGRLVLGTGFDAYAHGVEPVIIQTLHAPHPTSEDERHTTEMVFSSVLGRVINYGEALGILGAKRELLAS